MLAHFKSTMYVLYMLTYLSSGHVTLLRGEFQPPNFFPNRTYSLGSLMLGSALCRFMYCDECSLTGDNVLPVLYASKKYILPALTQLCLKFLKENLHVDNVCIIYEQCLHFDEASILDVCRSFIETRTDEVFASETFKDLSRTHMCSLLVLGLIQVNRNKHVPM